MGGISVESSDEEMGNRDGDLEGNRREQSKRVAGKDEFKYKKKHSRGQGGLFIVWVLWHINLCRLFDAKSIFIQIIIIIMSCR